MSGGAQSFNINPGERPDLSNPGNTSSSLAGSGGGPQPAEDAHEIQHTLPVSFTLANVRAETKGGDHLEPDTEPEGQGETATTADAKPDHKRKDVSDEVDIPGADPHAPPKPSTEGNQTSGAQY